jgi:RNA polymerase sigma-70 factor, ECF subfamily
MPIAADKILRASAGDQRALEDLIREYQQPIARFVASRLADRNAVEDVCQGIFVKMVLSIARLHTAEAFEPWLFRIAENACRDLQRRERWRKRLFVPLGERHDRAGPNADETETVSGPARAEIESAQLQRLRVGLEQVGAGQRELLTLSIERPRSYEELAALSHLSVPALKSRLFRARATLRRLMSRGESGS